MYVPYLFRPLSCTYYVLPPVHKKGLKHGYDKLCLTGRLPPHFANKFWQVRELVAVFNTHIAFIFVSSWAVCLDESMSIWYNRWTCPGWVYCPRNPHLFGNEYYTACCAKSGIMFSIKMVEDKDRPQELGAPEFAGTVRLQV